MTRPSTVFGVRPVIGEGVSAQPPRECAGRGGITVHRVDGASTVTSAWATSPLKLLVPKSRGPSVWACLSSFGGGMVAGDQTHLEMHLGTGARCFVGTQSSTKIYRNPLALPCGHRLNARLDAGSLLVLAPDPVQPFAGSRFVQRQCFDVAPGAELILLDWVTSGRSARGERWQFDCYESRNEVWVNGERTFADALRLDPRDGPLDGSHRLGRFNCIAMILILGESLKRFAEAHLADIGSFTVRRRGTLQQSISPVVGGCILRLAGESVEEATLEVRSRLRFLSDVLGEYPWARKF
ncbi:MAG: urease accessory protein UreD [Pedosphaera sp.]|nr:urease accessory protein UreD [Pedosphaera sp.]